MLLIRNPVLPCFGGRLPPHNIPTYHTFAHPPWMQVLIHNDDRDSEETVESDPYVMEEIDPAKSHAIVSMAPTRNPIIYTAPSSACTAGLVLTARRKSGGGRPPKR